MMSMRLLPLFVLALAAALPAQVKPGSGGRGEAPIGVRTEAQGQKGDGEVEAGDALAAEKMGKQPERSMSARGQCRFDVALRPSRLLPGQTGTVLVMMILEADAVLQVPANLTIEPAAPAPNLTLGAAQLRPPQPAGLAAAYRGQPVYDNYALIEIPVTMGTSAPLGSKQQALLNARFELHEGASGRSLGEFAQRIAVVCEVGASHDPMVQAGPPGAQRAGAPARQQEAAGEAGQARGDDIESAADAGAEASEQAATGLTGPGTAQAVEPEADAPDVQRTEPDRPVAERTLFGRGGDEAPMTSYLLVGGGALVVVVLLLMLLRRR